MASRVRRPQDRDYWRGESFSYNLCQPFHLIDNLCQLFPPQENPLKIYTGGASLIDYSIILTAAHPLEQIKSVVLAFQT